MNEIRDVLAFVKAGNALFTLVSGKTGNRFTYKVSKSKSGPVYFVSVLNGPDNYVHYRYMGILHNDLFKRTPRSKVESDAPSCITFKWFWNRAVEGTLPGSLTIFHEGRCGRCGRRLTVPTSIESGYGSRCLSIIGGK